MKNGVLTIELDEATSSSPVDAFKKDPEAEMTVDLIEQRVQYAGIEAKFNVNSFSGRACSRVWTSWDLFCGTKPRSRRSKRSR